jgi:hypothetical protein
MALQDVDAFVENRILPEHHGVVAMLRKLMRECAPAAEECISYGIPVWRGKNILALISPTKNDITFAFTHGAKFDDKYGLLKGAGKASKHVKIKDLRSANKEALRYYIKQALELDVN